MQTISRSSSSAVTFIFFPVTEFFLFMKHLYLDVLPLPKSKHGKKKRNSWCPLSLSILLFLHLHFQAGTLGFPCPVPVIHICRLVASSADSYSVLFYSCTFAFSQSHSCPCPVLPDYFRVSKRNCLSVFFPYFHGRYEKLQNPFIQMPFEQQDSYFLTLIIQQLVLPLVWYLFLYVSSKHKCLLR